jgi:polyisoprenoid-binding protein YceI
MAKWIIDPDHSGVTFSIRHMMIAQVRGQFCKIGGTIYFDPLDIQNASIELSFDATSINTGIQKRDDHLKSSDFFDVAKYPTISFKSNRIHSINGNKAKVTGDLTMHGITRQATVSVEFSGPVKDPFGDGTSIGFTASATINREDFGIMWNHPIENNGVMVGRDVQLFVDLEADLTP